MTDRLEFGDFAPEFTRWDTSRVVIVPVPYDGTSTYIKGADRGPQAILEASPNLEFYDIQTDSEVFTEGIYTDDAVDGDWQGPEAMAAAVRKRRSEEGRVGKEGRSRWSHDQKKKNNQP